MCAGFTQTLNHLVFYDNHGITQCTTIQGFDDVSIITQDTKQDSNALSHVLLAFFWSYVNLLRGRSWPAMDKALSAVAHNYAHASDPHEEIKS